MGIEITVNQTQTAVFIILLHLLLSADHVTRIYLHKFMEYAKEGNAYILSWKAKEGNELVGFFPCGIKGKIYTW